MSLRYGIVTSDRDRVVLPHLLLVAGYGVLIQLLVIVASVQFIIRTDIPGPR
jgi:hypothetical protein